MNAFVFAMDQGGIVNVVRREQRFKSRKAARWKRGLG